MITAKEAREIADDYNNHLGDINKVIEEAAKNGAYETTIPKMLSESESLELIENGYKLTFGQSIGYPLGFNCVTIIYWGNE